MSTSKTQLTWSSSLKELNKRSSKNLETLIDNGIKTINDLLWVIPRKVEPVPQVTSFESLNAGDSFKGIGEIVQVQSKMNFFAKGKGKVPLYNLTVIVKDHFSDHHLNLKWFNCYPNVQKKLKTLKKISFMGKVNSYNGLLQISNPNYEEYSGETAEEKQSTELLITYPTLNKVPTSFIKKLIDKIPSNLWNDIEETVPENILQARKLLSLKESFLIAHGKSQLWTKELFEEAKNRLIYEEFLKDQIKINIRKQYIKAEDGVEHMISGKDLQKFYKIFPYELTSDQVKTIQQIRFDLTSGKKMMRLIQGDVGCGKTSVALVSALISLHNKFQVALMAPTESLAIQHFSTIKDMLRKTDYRIEIILGSTKQSQKKKIIEDLENGDIHFIIGTHSLIQDSIQFNKLALVIIDEQHKFGVNQRLKLTSKMPGVHSLIMSATPIPRSLSLTQYGDLDISTIRTLPSNRKGTKTKIVKQDNFRNFLTFINTRISMKEQIYIVVPAIENNEETDIANLERVTAQFEHYFPDKTIQTIHGRFKADEKEDVFHRFKDNKINILIATSVVEVGIDVANATVMAIFGPERFGLSSLHQLRGRVGRGNKPGFCFLVLEKEISKESLERLKVIEKTTDGFKIAEKDLEFRGQGDIFGASQSGQEGTSKVLANIIIHQDVLEMAREDISTIEKENLHYFENYRKQFENNDYLTQTT